MRLENFTLDVETQGIKKKGKFKISATGKAFKVLSSGLYSNKVKAIIRELSCNAYDSHVDAGHPEKPFEVHIPTDNMPTFYIRDFGIGLEPEEIETLYVTYFQSTKTESNDMVGCLGLGSKSPFSYTQSFTVTSWKSGMKHSYACYLDEIGEPTVSHIHSEYSKEPTGLKVEFAVQGRDFFSFQEEAKNVYKHFSTQPEHVGAIIDIPEEVNSLEGKGWKIPEAAQHWRRPEPLAVMGNVAYPIEYASFTEELSDSSLELLRSGIILDFEIGELSVVASREGLEYHDLTVNNIKDRLEKVFVEILDKINEEFKSCKSLWEARKLLYKLSKEEFRFLSKSIREGLSKWNGQSVSTAIDIQDLVWGPNFIKIDKYFTSENYYRGGLTVSKDEIQRFLQVSLTETIFVFIHDINFKKPYTSRVREYLRETKPDAYLYTIRYKDGFRAEEFVNRLGLPEDQIKYAEDFFPKRTKKKKKKNTNTVAKKVPLLIWRGYVFSNKPSINWDDSTVDISSLDGYYVDVNRFSPILNGEKNEHYIHTISQMANVIKYIEKKDITVYGVRSSHKSAVKKNPNLKSLKDYAKTVYENNKNLPELKYINSINTADSVRNSLSFLEKELDDTHELVKIVKSARSICSKRDFLINFRALQQFFEPKNKSQSTDLLRAEFNSLNEKYPLVFKIESWNKNHLAKDLAHYVKLIDKN